MRGIRTRRREQEISSKVRKEVKAASGKDWV